MTNEQLAVLLRSYQDRLAAAITYAEERMEGAEQYTTRKYIGPRDGGRACAAAARRGASQRQ